MKRSMVISIIGRPNVGKSSLFNSLMKKSTKAITHDIPGVTRDRHYGIAQFNDVPDEEKKEAILVDTGGFYPQKIEEDGNTDQQKNFNKFFNIMAEHAHLAIEESDLILFVVDVRSGALPFDQSIADYLRQQKKKFWLIINKYDSDKQAGDEAEFYSLGIDPDEMFVTSAAHGLGMMKLRESIHSELLNFIGDEDQTALDLQKGVTPRENVISKLAIIGAPNAGKSTLLNQLLGAQRALVSNIPGTTVDPIEGFFDLYFGKDIVDVEESFNETQSFCNQKLIEEFADFQKNNPENEEDELYKKVFDSSMYDENEQTQEQEQQDEEESESGSYWRSLHVVDTAGIRRQKSVSGYIETQSVYRSLRSITEADIVLFLVDATKSISHQDRRLLDIALEKGKSLIVCLNKIDLLSEKLKTEKERREWMLDIRDTIPWLSYCDVIPLSAKYNKHIKHLKKSIKKTVLVRKRTIPTGELNRFVSYLVDKNPIIAKRSGGKRLRVKYASMIKADPPTFLLFSNKSKDIPDNYRRYLQNAIREKFCIYNTPVHLIFRSGKDDHQLKT